MGENPLNTMSFQEPPIRRIHSHPAVYSGVSHGCRLGIRHVRTDELLQKPTLWLSTSPEICDELSMKCLNETIPGHHVHGLCLGGADITAYAGKYTEEIAKAIHRGYVILLKHKEPGRIRSVLRLVSTKIRNGEQKGPLGWSEKCLKKAIRSWNRVFAVQNRRRSSLRRWPRTTAWDLADGFRKRCVSFWCHILRCASWQEVE